jgi:hypothetical protein
MFYPEKGTKTMIFFQRHIADFWWTAKIRSERYKSSKMAATNSFMRSLTNFLQQSTNK